MGSAPTNGNLLIAIAFVNNGFSAASGWTLLHDTQYGPYYVGIFYKVASSESTSQTPVSGASSLWAIGIWEVHGQNATPATALEAYGSGDPNQSHSTWSQTAIIPQITSTIVLLAMACNNAIAVAVGDAVRDAKITSNVASVFGHTDSNALLATLVVTAETIDSQFNNGWVVVSV